MESSACFFSAVYPRGQIKQEMADSDPDALPGTQSAHEVGAVSNVLRPLEHFSHFDFAASACGGPYH